MIDRRSAQTDQALNNTLNKSQDKSVILRNYATPSKNYNTQKINLNGQDDMHVSDDSNSNSAISDFMTGKSMNSMKKKQMSVKLQNKLAESPNSSEPEVAQDSHRRNIPQTGTFQKADLSNHYSTIKTIERTNSMDKGNDSSLNLGSHIDTQNIINGSIFNNSMAEDKNGDHTQNDQILDLIKVLDRLIKDNTDSKHPIIDEYRELYKIAESIFRIVMVSISILLFL